MEEAEKLKNQRTVINIKIESDSIFNLVDQVNDDFLRNKVLKNNENHPISKTGRGHPKVTYRFGNIEDAQYFGALLDQKEVAFSYHPYKDYHEVATQGMNTAEKILLNFPD